MTPQQIASTILAKFTSGPDLYPSLGMHGNIRRSVMTLSRSVMTLSTSTGVTIIAIISVARARIEMEHGASIVRSAVFTDSSPEGLVDATVGYIARILSQLNDQAAE